MPLLCRKTMSPGVWKGNNPNVNPPEFLHRMDEYVDWRKRFYAFDDGMRAVLCNNHRQFPEVFLDIESWRRVIVADANRRVVDFYVVYYPSPDWKALTPSMPLFNHRVFIKRTIYSWPRFVYGGLTHLADYRLCESCGTLGEPESTECHAHFRDPEASPPPPLPKHVLVHLSQSSQD